MKRQWAYCILKAPVGVVCNDNRLRVVCGGIEQIKKWKTEGGARRYAERRNWRSWEITFFYPGDEIDILGNRHKAK